jgi:hypothetical protein
MIENIVTGPGWWTVFPIHRKKMAAAIDVRDGNDRRETVASSGLTSNASHAAYRISGHNGICEPLDVCVHAR